MYSTSQIALFLGVKRERVNYYIRKGFLKARLNDNDIYRISEVDYRYFRDNYFDADKRNSNRGKIKKLTEDQIIQIDHMIHDTTNDYVSVEDFKNRYENDFCLLDIYRSLLEYKINIQKE